MEVFCDYYWYAIYSYENNGDRDQSITTGGDTIDTNYDSQGSLASYSHTHTGGTDLYSFNNDSFGQRVETLKNSLVQSRLVYNSQRQVVTEITPTGELVHYIYATQSHSPDYIIKNGTIYKLVKDQIGSIRLVVNSSNGTIVDSTEYDEFGVKLSSTSPGFISLGFAGGIEDLATGLVRFGARDYDPDLGRWTAKDPIKFAGQDSNIYNYVNGDPVNRIDPSGLLFEDIISNVINPEQQVILGMAMVYAGVQLTRGALALGFTPQAALTALGGLALISEGTANLRKGVDRVFEPVANFGDREPSSIPEQKSCEPFNRKL